MFGPNGFILFSLIIYVSAQKNVTELNIPPSITIQSQPDELLFQVKRKPGEHDRIFFIPCEAQGNPKPKITWTKEGKIFHPSGPRFHLRPNSGMLTILSPRSSDSGLYQCIAENPFGIASARPVNVKEAFLDNFEDKPAAQIKGLVGSSLVLNCEAPEGYPKPEIFWMIQSENSLSLVNSSVAINTKNGSLVFANYQSENADLYSCVATNLFRNEFKLGDRKTVSTLQGTTEPKEPDFFDFWSGSSRSEFLYGETIKIGCIFTGFPTPKISWKRKDGRKLSKDKSKTEENGRILLVEKATLRDEGIYICTAENGIARIGDSTIKSQSVTVNVIPVLKSFPGQIRKFKSESVTFQCKAEGKPMPEMEWFFNGKSIRKYFGHEERWTMTQDTLKIRNLQISDIGVIGCNASNSYGYDYKEGYIMVEQNTDDFPNESASESAVLSSHFGLLGLLLIGISNFL